MKTDEELGSWTFGYYTEDGNYHSIIITAPSFLDAVDAFTQTFGEETSFAVSV